MLVIYGRMLWVRGESQDCVGCIAQSYGRGEGGRQEGIESMKDKKGCEGIKASPVNKRRKDCPGRRTKIPVFLSLISVFV